MRLKNVPALILILQLILGPFTPFAQKTYATNMNDTAEGNNGDADSVAPDEETPKGLRFHLSEGAEQAERPAPRPAVAPATKLSEGETARVLQRLPPLKEAAGDEQEFALRERSQPPPRAGATVLNAFPAAEERRAPDDTAPRRSSNSDLIH